jgi:hypothetical protein
MEMATSTLYFIIGTFFLRPCYVAGDPKLFYCDDINAGWASFITESRPSHECSGWK